ncbi:MULTISPECIES: hypothetical protein [Streptomyces]|uniref:hypothetical protein n=1 Tax=Streptomyces TaxID=1883 RepID=UPI00224938B5|nr:hypothetical protein [Streptomyces sp. JHD 1]MCX2967700.1 hypothetical protein [Streptomyces sp. JHD 1]
MAPDALPQAWQQLLALAERPADGSAGDGASPPAGDGSAVLSLASTEGGAPRGGKLRHSAGPWTSAAGTAERLRDSMGSAKSTLETSHQGVAAEGAGLASVVELDGVRSTWEARLEDAREECDSLVGKLGSVAKEHGENESATTATFQGTRPDGGR